MRIYFVIMAFIFSNCLFGTGLLFQDGIDTIPPAAQQIMNPKLPVPATTTLIDSIPEVEQIFLYDSLFSVEYGSQLTEIYSRREETQGNDYRFAIILLLMLIYVTWLTYTYRKELRENTIVLVNTGLGQQIYRDREFSANIFRLLTFTNFAIVTGVAIYLTAIKFNVQLIFNMLWFNITAAVGIVMIAYLLKGVCYRVVGGLYELNPLVSFFRFNSLVIYQMLGIALFPFIVFGVFAPQPVNEWALFCVFGLFGIALLLRLVKGISLLGMMKDFHILYFLLYICALEIAPVLILIRLFSMWT